MRDDRSRYAAIDIGTNSVRLLIARLANRQLQAELRTLRTCRLGEGMTRGDGLQPQAVARTLQSLQEFNSIIQARRVRRLRAVATSAVREAANAGFFIEQVRSETGIAVEVITGEEEACLSYIGACTSLPGVRGGAVVDIGGGSTELTWRPGAGRPGLPVSHSVPVGAVRLTEQPMLLSGILSRLKPALEGLGKAGPAPLIGVGGAVTTLAAIDQGLAVYDPERAHGYRLSRTAVERILFFLSAKTNGERKQVPGLQPERADIIVGGATILWAILGFLQAEQVTVSEADILDGIILTSFQSQQ